MVCEENKKTQRKHKVKHQKVHLDQFLLPQIGCAIDFQITRHLIEIGDGLLLQLREMHNLPLRLCHEYPLKPPAALLSAALAHGEPWEIVHGLNGNAFGEYVVCIS